MKKKFKDLSYEELCKIEGGLIGGVVLGALNGACIGLAASLVGGICNREWEYEDTKNMVKAGTIAGGYLGQYLPL